LPCAGELVGLFFAIILVMTQRVIVFLDEKNVYKSAREAFFEKTAYHTKGNVHPLDVANLLVSKLPVGVTEPRALQEVRLYTGRPSSSIEPKSYGAHMKQCSGWEKVGVNVITRPLRYLTRTPPGDQKGVDVALAVDFVTLAIEGAYDVGIIFSRDSDLRPALEYVTSKPSFPRAEVACWWSPKAQSYLSIAGISLWSHRLIEADYKSVCDHTDYNL
jgi:uncharacterized LabA/DUF88 family protein